MAAKYMKIQKIVIPFITLLILVSQLTGCSPLTSQEALEEIDNGSDVVIEYSVPDNTDINADTIKINETEIIVDKNKFTQEEFIKFCELAYNKVWRNPDINYYEFKYSTTYLEIDMKWLNFFTESEAGSTST